MRGVQKAPNRGLTIFPAFSEGKTAAYMTTEIWQNFDEVWVQPLYVEPIKNGNPPIFGFDSTTRFYSPYCQICTYSHPPGLPEFQSAKDVLDSHVPLAPNSGTSCTTTRTQS